MTRRREEALQAALEAVQRGQSIEEVLAGLPAPEAEELRSLVTAASDAGSLRSGDIPADAQRRSRARLLRLAASRPVPRAGRGRILALMPRLSAAALVALVALGLGFGGLSSAAADALPGEWLYPLKVAAADLRLRLEFEAGQRLRLESLYAEQRLEDVRHLLGLGRVVPVSFVGQVGSIGSVSWWVEDIPIRLTPQTRVVGRILPGMFIEVEGVTQVDGTVLADELHLQSYDILGTLEAIDADTLTIDGRAFDRTKDSYIEPGLAAGQRILVRASIDDAGRHIIVSAVRFLPPTPTPAPAVPTVRLPSATPPPTAAVMTTPTEDDHDQVTGTPEPDEEDGGSEEDESESEKIEVEGLVESVSGSLWIVAGRTFRVDGQTEIHDNPGVGDLVKVIAFLQSDGSWWAEKIEARD